MPRFLHPHSRCKRKRCIRSNTQPHAGLEKPGTSSTGRVAIFVTQLEGRGPFGGRVGLLSGKNVAGGQGDADARTLPELATSGLAIQRS